MKKNQVLAIIGAIITFVLAIASIYFLIKVCTFDILPGKFLTVLVIIILILFLGVTIAQFFRVANIVGDILGVVVIVAFFVASYFIGFTKDTLDNKLQAGDTKDIAIEVMVLKDSYGSDIKDIGAVTFGIPTDATFGKYYTQTLEAIKKDIGYEVKTQSYPDNVSMAKALIKGDIGAMLITSAYTATVDDAFQSMTKEDDGYLGENEAGEPIPFSDKARTLKTYTITVLNEEHNDNPSGGGGIPSKPQKPQKHETLDTSQIPFVVYVSGIDVTGDISTVSRSDVNVLVAINPVTRQIAMITTPRDSYVTIPGVTEGSNYNDKLTHAGLYGTACSASMATLERIYGVEIDYYLRVNFTSVVDIVDLLGGISVYSGTDFTERWDGFHFKVGYNDVNGTQALHFARERYTIRGGDYARGRNHTELIKAILNKAMSPSILANYTTLLTTISKNIETNISTEEIAALVKMQLDDSSEWNFVSYCTEGINGGQQEFRYCYSYMGGKLCVTILDEESVAGGSDLIERVLNGEIIKQEDSYTEGTFDL